MTLATSDESIAQWVVTSSAKKNSNSQDHIGYELAADLTSFTGGPFIMSSPLEVGNVGGSAGI